MGSSLKIIAKNNAIPQKTISDLTLSPMSSGPGSNDENACPNAVNPPPPQETYSKNAVPKNPGIERNRCLRRTSKLSGDLGFTPRMAFKASQTRRVLPQRAWQSPHRSPSPLILTAAIHPAAHLVPPHFVVPRYLQFA